MTAIGPGQEHPESPPPQCERAWVRFAWVALACTHLAAAVFCRAFCEDFAFIRNVGHPTAGVLLLPFIVLIVCLPFSLPVMALVVLILREALRCDSAILRVTVTGIVCCGWFLWVRFSLEHGIPSV